MDRFVVKDPRVAAAYKRRRAAVIDLAAAREAAEASRKKRQAAEVGLLWPPAKLLDCAPVHVGQPFRDSLRVRLDHVTLCFIPPTFTATCQPLDIHYMSRLKTGLASRVAEWMAATVLNAVSEDWR